MKSDNKEEIGSSSIKNKYKNRIKSEEKELSILEKQNQKEAKEFKIIEEPEEQKPKEKAKIYLYSEYQGKYLPRK